MSTSGNESALVFANVGVHTGVPIKARLAPHGIESVEINIGDSPELVLDFADVEILERLRDAAGEGARLLRDRIEEHRSTAVQARTNDTDVPTRTDAAG